MGVQENLNTSSRKVGIELGKTMFCFNERLPEVGRKILYLLASGQWGGHSPLSRCQVVIGNFNPDMGDFLKDENGKFEYVSYWSYYEESNFDMAIEKSTVEVNHFSYTELINQVRLQGHATRMDVNRFLSHGYAIFEPLLRLSRVNKSEFWLFVDNGNITSELLENALEDLGFKFKK